MRICWTEKLKGNIFRSCGLGFFHFPFFFLLFSSSRVLFKQSQLFFAWKMSMVRMKAFWRRQIIHLYTIYSMFFSWFSFTFYFLPSFFTFNLDFFFFSCFFIHPLERSLSPAISLYPFYDFIITKLFVLSRTFMNEFRWAYLTFHPFFSLLCRNLKL